jgi:hypothetical protein
VLQRDQSFLSGNTPQYATIRHLSQTGDVLGATQILEKIKTESKENRSRLVAEPPWPPLNSLIFMVLLTSLKLPRDFIG